MGIIINPIFWNNATLITIFNTTEINEIYNSVGGTNDYAEDFGNYISSNNLGAYWKFNEGSGNTLYDYSGNDYHGTIYGATWVEFEISNAFL